MKIGIIGGTFDPLHVSHINIASEAKKQFDLEQIWFMLSPNPPHKNSETVNSFEVRFEMLNIGLRDNCSFIPCDYEYKNGYRYTADTLTFLKKDSLSFKIEYTSVRNVLTISGLQDCDVSMTMAKSSIFLTSLYSNGSINGMFSYNCKP